MSGKLIITRNKKAYFNYEIIHTLEAGIVLFGSEIKSIKNKDVSINEAFVLIRLGQVEIINMNIKTYKFSTQKIVDATRTRKLLLNESEIRKWSQKIKEEKLTVVPLQLYLKNGLAKLEIGLVRGKKNIDKREVIKQRDEQRRLNNIKR